MSNPYTRLARRLATALGDDQRTALSGDPRGFLQAMGIRVRPLQHVPASEMCACDGAYFPYPFPNIAYAPTPGSRRQNFTLAHEFGHHLIRGNDDVLSALHDLDENAGRVAEERVCHAFASLILVPDQVIEQILAGRPPEARHLREVFTASSASLEACAVRLAEYLPANGYVAIVEPTDRRIRFASPSPGASYQWGRHTPLPAQHPLWRVHASGAFRGQGQVVWASGSRMSLWLDAVADGNLVHAVFSETRYWGGEGLSLLDQPPTAARPTAMSGSCRHCGADTWGYTACPKCDDVRCRLCGCCGCGAPPPTTRLCSICSLEKGKGQFRSATTMACRDCEQ
jgi:Zn-dependent peptidase ImmA (M78 family)